MADDKKDKTRSVSFDLEEIAPYIPQTDDDDIIDIDDDQDGENDDQTEIEDKVASLRANGVRKLSRQRPTSFMPKPGTLQRHFMKSIQRNKADVIDKSLQENPDLNLQLYTDNYGRSALEKAVSTGSADVVDIFINRSNTAKLKLDLLKHAMLYAVKENHPKLVKHLIQKKPSVLQEVEAEDRASGRTTSSQSTLETKKGFLWKKKKKESVDLTAFQDAEFDNTTSPLQLAAQLERHEIIQLLIDSKECDIHALTDKSVVNCTCVICRGRRSFKGVRSLEEAHRIQNVYDAMTSPAFIFRVDIPDPIYEVFKLSQDMSRMKFQEPAYAEEYKKMSKNCRLFAAELLDLCRTTDEVEILMKTDLGVEEINTKGYATIYPRLLVALYYDQKEFIAHAHCQQVLQRTWHMGLPDVVAKTSYPDLMLLLFVLIQVPFLPFMCLLYSMKLFPAVERFMKLPIEKLISDSISYITFLILIIIDASSPPTKDMGATPTIVQWLLFVWILGMSVRQIKMLFRQRRQLSLTSTVSFWQWRSYELLMLTGFMVSIILRIVGMVMIRNGDKNLRHRWNLPSSHPILVAECFYVLAVIMAFVRINGLFKASSSIGPLQISLKRMTQDILRFMLLFFVIMTAYVVGITKLYGGYMGYIRKSNNDTREQRDEFSGFQNTYKTLFWDLFVDADVRTADIVVDNQQSLNQTIKHKLTEVVGFFLVGSYHVVAIIVLVNLLIAVMANSFNEIETNADLEWKVARTRLRMTYFNEVGAIPPPFNLLPFGTLFKIIKHFCSKEKCVCCRCRISPCCVSNKEDLILNSIRLRDKYRRLMEQLNKRYWNRRLAKEGVTGGSTNEASMEFNYSVTDTSSSSSSI